MEWDDWAGDFANPSAEDIAFEEDWAAVTGGQYTIDEIANQDDINDLYYGYLEDPSILEGLGDILSRYGSSAVKGLKNVFTKPDGNVDWRSIATVGGGLMGLMGLGGAKQQPTGYQGKIPEYTAVRERVDVPYEADRRPGSGGRRYFSDVSYTKPEELEAARAAATEQATGLAALNAANLANEKRPVAPTATATPVEETTPRPASAVIEDKPVPTYAAGGIAGLKSGQYLRGSTDGMSDELRTKIVSKDGEQPAALSHGEFVIPADVVSHLGNGNSEAGAKKLYEMMARIRKARTGTSKQGKEVNPNKYLFA
jgi:hypothetical protein